MSARPQILDVSGRPIKSAYAAHEAADRRSREIGSWQPTTYSADSEWLGEIETARDRLDDLIRNNGIASGAVQKHVDNTIGSGLLLNYRPDRRALGLKADDRAEEMDAFEDEVEAKFDSWAEDPGNYVDASRRCRLSGLFAQGYRSYLSAFEITATGEWLKRPGTDYRTAIQMIDPRRLSNPNGERDSDKLRGGVRLGAMGEPIGYYFASHVLGDPTGLSNAYRTWRYVTRETPWGRQQVLHVYDVDKPGRSRGKGGVLSILSAHKMHEKWTKASVEAAVFNSLYAAYIESQLDWKSVAEAMGANDGEQTLGAVDRYFEGMTAYHKAGHIRFNGLRIPHLFPGEQLKHLAPAHPAPSFEAFERAANRRLAAGWHLTYPQVSNDYSQSNYSSDRAALLDVYRFFAGRQYHIAAPLGTWAFSLFFEEAIDRGDIVLPAGLPDYYEAKGAWLGCDWIGPGRGHIDILKEANGKKVLYSMGLETMESLASQDGKRWRKLLEQRAQEERYMRKLGMDPAQFNGPSPVAQPPDVQQVDKDGDPIGGPEGGDGGAPAPGAAPKPAPKPGGGGGAAAAVPQSQPRVTVINLQPGMDVGQIAEAIRYAGDRNAEAARAAGEERAAADREIAEDLEGVEEGLVVLAGGTREQLAALGDRISGELNRPTVLVKDTSGRTIGARRVDSLPGGSE